MTDPDITDTGPLEWSPDRHTRAQWVASFILVVALLAIAGMLVFWSWWE